MTDRESLIARLRSNAAIHRDVLDAAADMLESEAARFAELEAEVARLTSDRMDVSDLTADAIEAAVLEEREACAKIADAYDVRPLNGDWTAVADDIAAAIRARSAP